VATVAVRRVMDGEQERLAATGLALCGDRGEGVLEPIFLARVAVFADDAARPLGEV
jgi:hypothetical protein